MYNVARHMFLLTQINQCRQKNQIIYYSNSDKKESTPFTFNRITRVVYLCDYQNRVKVMKITCDIFIC